MSKFCAFLLAFCCCCCCFSKSAAFYSSKQFQENPLLEQVAIPVTSNVVKRSAINAKESSLSHKPDLHDNQDGGQLNNSHSNKTALATNETEHHGHEGEKHHGIHLASWNFDHVQGPLIIAVFLLTAGIAKLGKYLYFIQQVTISSSRKYLLSLSIEVIIKILRIIIGSLLQQKKNNFGQND